MLDKNQFWANLYCKKTTLENRIWKNLFGETYLVKTDLVETEFGKTYFGKPCLKNRFRKTILWKKHSLLVTHRSYQTITGDNQSFNGLPAAF